MRAPEVHPIVDLLMRFCDRHGASRVSAEKAEAFTFGLLFGERALWQAFQNGLVLQDEVLDAILDRFRIDAFGVENDGPRNLEWAALRGELAGRLFPTDEPV